MILAGWCGVVVAVISVVVSMLWQVRYARQENRAEARLIAAIESLTKDATSQGDRTGRLLAVTDRHRDRIVREESVG